MAEKKKERVELQFNLENEAEKELIEFIDQNGTTRAGFIKSVIRQYMNTMQSLVHQNLTTQKPNKTKPTTKKQIPKLGQSFSSNDFE